VPPTPPFNSTNVPQPFVEATISSISQTYGHNRMPIQATPHLATDPGPMLSHTMSDFDEAWFHGSGLAPGLVRVQQGACVDHAKFGMKAIKGQDAILSYRSKMRKISSAFNAFDDPDMEITLKALFGKIKMHKRDQRNTTNGPGKLNINPVNDFFPWGIAIVPKSIIEWRSFVRNDKYKMFWTLRIVCRASEKWFNQWSGFARHYRSDSPGSPPIRERYDGTTKLVTTDLKRWCNISKVDDLLEDMHSQVETTNELFVVASKEIQQKKTTLNHSDVRWKVVRTSDTGGITASSICGLGVKSLDVILKHVLPISKTISMFKGRDAKVSEIEKILLTKDQPRTGTLDKACELFYYHSTCDTNAQLAATNCSMHLLKSETNQIVQSTLFFKLFKIDNKHRLHLLTNRYSIFSCYFFHYIFPKIYV
jgi:hypothetical protein